MNNDKRPDYSRRNGCAIPLLAQAAEEERPKTRRLSVMRDKGRLSGSP